MIDKYADAINMYETGKSIIKCAIHYDISRQAMTMILKRRGCNFRTRRHHKAQSSLRGKKVYLGVYYTKEDADKAYDNFVNSKIRCNSRYKLKTA